MSSPLRDRLNRAVDMRAQLKPVQEIEAGMLHETITLDTEVHPWRRLTARLVDIAIYGALTLPMLGPALWLSVMFTGSGQWMPAAVTVVSALLLACGLILALEGFLTSYWGKTLGKQLFHLQVANRAGERLGYLEALGRTAKVGGFIVLAVILSPVLLAGPALCIWQYTVLKKTGYTLWDAAQHTRVGIPPVRDF